MRKIIDRWRRKCWNPRRTTNEDDFIKNLLNVPTVKLKSAVTISGLGFDDYFLKLGGRYHTQFWNIDAGVNPFNLTVSNGVTSAIGGWNLN